MLFIARVFEGAVTWGDLRDADLEEIDFLFNQAEEANSKLKQEMDAAKSKGRSRGRRF